MVLQHGSILLGPDHRRIVEFFSESDPQLRTAVEDELKLHTTDLLEATGRHIPYEEIAQAVRHGFETSWKIRFAEGHAPAPGKVGDLATIEKVSR